ncbi:hypothetical protein CPB84DRAFT_1787834 [Gymnopilus junonius]|uniref:Uncharacterized protein n=1 Tax=Gymnopilus junonius TaxID=109634 RepID=A0A9P5TK58_GYMJU|nr:hypothetical protein CPB84DRAFT_1787834 [Gymnopilus junonius]
MFDGLRSLATAALGYTGAFPWRLPCVCDANGAVGLMNKTVHIALWGPDVVEIAVRLYLRRFLDSSFLTLSLHGH